MADRGLANTALEPSAPMRTRAPRLSAVVMRLDVERE
jgi:hypothetical protein